MNQIPENPWSKEFDTTVSPQKSQRRGCLWIFIFIGVLVLIGCVALCLGVFALVLQLGKEPYEMAVNKVKQDAQVKEKLGEPIEVAGWFPQWSVNVKNDQGAANLTFQIRGPKGKATVNVVARRIGGKWGLTSLDLTYADGTRQSIDVSGEGSTEMDAPRWQPDVPAPMEPPKPENGEATQSEEKQSGEEKNPPALDVKIPELPKL